MSMSAYMQLTKTEFVTTVANARWWRKITERGTAALFIT